MSVTCNRSVVFTENQTSLLFGSSASFTFLHFHCYTPRNEVVRGYTDFTMSVRPLVRPFVRPFTRKKLRYLLRNNRYLSFYWKKWFYIWYMALAWRLVPCLPFPGLPHIYFLFTVRLRIFHVCHNENFGNSYLSFYWKKWFYIWCMALAWWLVLCLPFPGLQHIYFLFTVRLANERVGVFLARRSVQHLVVSTLIWLCSFWHAVVLSCYICTW